MEWAVRIFEKEKVGGKQKKTNVWDVTGLSRKKQNY